uniref:PX domain containing 1b n=1 Tax=Neogobius melanostomus TaxID=47308 RepID=A0A8C6UJB4_9GOBI
MSQKKKHKTVPHCYVDHSCLGSACQSCTQIDFLRDYSWITSLLKHLQSSATLYQIYRHICRSCRCADTSFTASLLLRSCGPRGTGKRFLSWNMHMEPRSLGGNSSQNNLPVSLSYLTVENSSTGLVKIKEASDIEEKLNEVERLLKSAIHMPCKFSRSEVMLTFFERSPLDQVLRNDKVHRIQPCFQSPIKISEIMRSNGFCLANTETIVFDQSPEEKERPSSTDSAENTYEDETDLLPMETELCNNEDTEAYVTNLSYYHLVPFETDILE